MAVVSYTLSDMGLASLAAYSPRLVFTPSGPAVKGSILFASRPIGSTPNTFGEGTVTLSSTETMIPETWYTLTITWLDSAGNYISKDFPDWKIRVPAADGDLSDMIDAPAPGYLIWFGPEPPINPSEYTGWIDTDNGNFYEWE